MNLTYQLSLNRIIKIISFLTFTVALFSVNGQENAKTAQIELIFSKENSKIYITAKVNELINDSIGKSVEEIDLFFYVQRTFSLLPIGDYFNTTDENGEVRVEFPSDLPGDSAGNVTVIVKLLEAEEFLDSEIKETINWGVPTYFSPKDNLRTLWTAGANAPISLLLLVNILIAAVWGVIFFIIYKIYLISKM